MATKISFQMPNFANLLDKAVNDSIQEVGFRIEQVAKESAPVDTGYYRNNISFDGKNKVTAHANYSASIEYGITNPVLIKPKNAQVLHFRGKDGKDVFVKWAQQKARKPNPIMRNASRKVQKEVKTIFKKNFGKI